MSDTNPREQMYSVKLSLVLTWSMFLIVTILIVPLSKPLAIIYVLSVLFVTFVCPYWLKWVQQYKKYVSLINWEGNGR